jgi:hypothetical protein
MNWRTDVPADKQECNIYLDRGMACSVIFMHIGYFADVDSFVDLFDSPEAGSMIKRDRISGWCPAEDIPDPEEFKCGHL